MSATADVLTLDTIEPGVTLSATPPSGWRAVTACRLLVIIGLTGSGKTTLMANLRSKDTAFSLLPNRRALTDNAIIPRYSDQPVVDRLRRFELSRRFLQSHPGGMAQIVEQLSIDPVRFSHPLVFDGLRGVDEVTYATEALPLARFLILTASDFVRLTRLVLRSDSFDRTQGSATDAGAALPDTELLTAIERFQLASWMQLGALDPGDIRTKLDIIMAERQVYESDRAIQVMMEAAPGRTFVVDTAAVPPSLVATIAARLLEP